MFMDQYASHLSKMESFEARSAAGNIPLDLRRLAMADISTEDAELTFFVIEDQLHIAKTLNDMRISARMIEGVYAEYPFIEAATFVPSWENVVDDEGESYTRRVLQIIDVQLAPGALAPDVNPEEVGAFLADCIMHNHFDDVRAENLGLTRPEQDLAGVEDESTRLYKSMDPWSHHEGEPLPLKTTREAVLQATADGAIDVLVADLFPESWNDLRERMTLTRDPLIHVKRARERSKPC